MSTALVNLVGIDNYCNLHQLDQDVFETKPECEERDTVDHMTVVSGLVSEGISAKKIKCSLYAHLSGHPNVISRQLARPKIHEHSDSYHPFTILVAFIVIAVIGAVVAGRYMRSRPWL